MADRGHTLTWKERLHSRRDFLRVYSQGQRVFTPTLVAYFLKNSLDYDRLGMTVSRRIGNAVVRNRVKRRIRELFRTTRRPASGFADIVVNARKPAATSPFHHLQKDYTKILEGVGKIRE